MKIRAEVPTLQMPFSWLIILPMSSASMLLSPLLVGCSFQAHSLPLSPYTHIKEYILHIDYIKDIHYTKT